MVVIEEADGARDGRVIEMMSGDFDLVAVVEDCTANIPVAVLDPVEIWKPILLFAVED